MTTTLLGKWLVPANGGIAAVTLYPLTESGGVLTRGTAVQLKGHLRRLSRRNSRQMVERHPMAAVMANNIAKLDNYAWTLTEILQDQTGVTGAVPSLVKNLYGTYRYVEAIADVGGVTDDLVGIFCDIDEDLDEDGGEVTVTIMQVGITATNPVWTSDI